MHSLVALVCFGAFFRPIKRDVINWSIDVCLIEIGITGEGVIADKVLEIPTAIAIALFMVLTMPVGPVLESLFEVMRTIARMLARLLPNMPCLVRLDREAARDQPLLAILACRPIRKLESAPETGRSRGPIRTRRR
jgi:hypothetical protein